jgi:hypothetical protein
MSTDAAPANVVELHFQYAHNGNVMMDDAYGEQDADSAAAFTRDGCAFVACERAPRGGWRIVSTDGAACPVPLSAYRYRFRTWPTLRSTSPRSVAPRSAPSIRGSSNNRPTHPRIFHRSSAACLGARS